MTDVFIPTSPNIRAVSLMSSSLPWQTTARPRSLTVFRRRSATVAAMPAISKTPTAAPN